MVIQRVDDLHCCKVTKNSLRWKGDWFYTFRDILHILPLQQPMIPKQVVQAVGILWDPVQWV